MKVFLSAGEASGDAYGAALVERMRVLRPSASFVAIGSERLRASGADIVADSRDWGAISIVESAKVYLRVRRGRSIARKVLAGDPGLFLPIDFGALNIQLAREAKARGWKVLYFIPPGSWRRDRQGKDIPAVTDLAVCPFPWAAEMLTRMGANASFFGHPLKELLGPPTAQPREGLAVLPGSRSHELRELLPVFARALRGFGEPVTLALAPHLSVAQVRRRWLELSGRENDAFRSGETTAVLRTSRAALVCSGTATLEAALCRTPMVVAYRVSKPIEWEARLVRFQVPQFVSLPNLVLERMAVPELIQNAATPKAIREAVDAILGDGPARGGQLRAFGELDDALGPDNALTRTAALAVRMLDG
jgi:lipid-A-disaccharide synthase